MKKPKFMYKNFKEYAEAVGIPNDHQYWEAFRLVWEMSRTPYVVLEQMCEQVDTKGKK